MSKVKTMDLDQQALDNFKTYLKIPSVHPDVNYDPCVEFLKKQAEALNLTLNIYEVVPKKPIVILTWTGTDPQLQSILLNSHMDVVPVFREKWTFDPFGAQVDSKGNIYARGTQDMKSVGIQYLEAVRRLKHEGIKLKRTIHISFVPDEETGGVDGMRKFALTKDFVDLRVGFALDEGLANPNEEFSVFYGERCIWHMVIHCQGQSGHGSLLLKNTPGEKVAGIMQKFYEFRRTQEQLLENNPSWTVGDVTTINLTQIQGGVQNNVVPSEMVLSFDIRIPVTVNTDEFEKTIREWCRKIGGDEIWIEFDQKEDQVPVTKLDSTNPYWIAFKNASDKMNLKLKAQIFTGGTDSRFIRGVGIPAIGFSPMNHTPILLHDHDEFLNQDIFLKGIAIYCQLIQSIGNVCGVANMLKKPSTIDFIGWTNSTGIHLVPVLTNPYQGGKLKTSK